MASSREILKRRRSVANIHKITKTMEMISTARFQRGHRRASAAQAYVQEMGALLAQVIGGQWSQDEAAHPLLQANEKSRRCVLLVLTSNRGLCGGYNSNVLRVALAQIAALQEAGIDVEVEVSGKKGAQAFRFLQAPVSRSFTEFDDKATFEETARLADEYCNRYAAGHLNGVGVVTTHFVSAARHEPTVVALLPVEPDDVPGWRQGSASRNCLYSPDGGAILEAAAPAWVRSRLFECFVGAAASEQSARMRAMKSATDNAEQMLRALTRHYNRVRQSNITSELLDIMGGAEALK